MDEVPWTRNRSQEPKSLGTRRLFIRVSMHGLKCYWIGILISDSMYKCYIFLIIHQMLPKKKLLMHVHLMLICSLVYHVIYNLSPRYLLIIVHYVCSVVVPLHNQSFFTDGQNWWKTSAGHSSLPLWSEFSYAYSIEPPADWLFSMSMMKCIL